MIKLKDLLLESRKRTQIEYFKDIQVNVYAYDMIWKWMEKRTYTRSPYKFNDLKKLEKKVMKFLYKGLNDNFNIDKNNVFLKLQSKILSAEIFGRGGVIDQYFDWREKEVKKIGKRTLVPLHFEKRIGKQWYDKSGYFVDMVVGVA
jgi:hypothetical protein|tara:strand:- start:979 stop:1416 length:438 start_codon:yes stop_codon:yes gene_type:complete